ncbi:uncharacterized protein ARMOST_05084 [Armillaria ostoyae]|uniref:Uncharacterized protein n=1 Tax=Armillaria ostoyae TaxID=47428 RepID=A0A284QZ54_ARMOS|nr:uncharacterized protein ARMOST_05084 [Armillaria ostoyae]
MVRDNHHQSIQSAPTVLLDQLQDRVEEMARAYKNHTAALQVRIENLEEEKRRLVKEVQTTQQLNDEFRRRLESAQDSSTGVAKKNYDHALRLIRDLIKDRPLAAEGDGELNQAVVNDLTALEDSDTEESASTVRPPRTSPPTQALNPPYDMELLQAHFGADRLPGFVTETHCRSLKRTRLVKFLDLDVDTENALESLVLANDLNPRIHGTEEGLLFVYYPIFLEFPSEGGSYFIDWSSKEVNQRIQEYLIKKESDKKPLHVFVFPQSKKKWYYVGAHRICVLDTRDPCPIWARLSNSNRPRIAHHIAERCHYDENQVSQSLDADELEEVCLAVYPVEEEETNDLLSRLPEKNKAK